MSLSFEDFIFNSRSDLVSYEKKNTISFVLFHETVSVMREMYLPAEWSQIPLCCIGGT